MPLDARLFDQAWPAGEMIAVPGPALRQVYRIT